MEPPPAFTPGKPPAPLTGPALPVPRAGHVADFQALYERRFGVALEWGEAQRALAALMQFVYLREPPDGPPLLTPPPLPGVDSTRSGR